MNNKKIIVILSIITVVLLAIAIILFCFSKPFANKTKEVSAKVKSTTSLSTSIQTTTEQTTTNTEKIDSYAPYKRIWYGDLEGMLVRLRILDVYDGVLTGELSIEDGVVDADFFDTIYCNYMDDAYYGENAVEISDETFDVRIWFDDEKMLVLKLINEDVSFNCVMR